MGWLVASFESCGTVGEKSRGRRREQEKWGLGLVQMAYSEYNKEKGKRVSRRWWWWWEVEEEEEEEEGLGA
jgi:hypothetical protein